MTAATEAPVSPDSARVHGILTAYLQSKAAFTALELGLFEELEKEPRTLPELAESLGLQRRPTRALLMSLRGIGLVSRTGDVYANTDETSRYLVASSPEYMGVFAEHQNNHFAHFAKLGDAVRTNASLNQRVLKDGYRDQGAAKGEGREGTGRLIQAMRVSSRLQASQLAALAPLDGVRRLIDLGCGSGDYSIAMAQAHPDVQVMSLDYPAVCDLVRANLAEAGLSDVVQVHPTDILREPWPDTDAVLLSHVTDGYGPERAAELVKTVYDRLPAGGRLIVHQHMPTLATGVFPYMFGLILLVNTDEGEVRDEEDIVPWMQAAGFRNIRTANVSLLSGMVVGEK